MKYLWLIEKCGQRAWGTNPWYPHQIFANKKNALRQCEELNGKAQRYQYQVTKVLNGDVAQQEGK